MTTSIITQSVGGTQSVGLFSADAQGMELRSPLDCDRISGRYVDLAGYKRVSGAGHQFYSLWRSPGADMVWRDPDGKLPVARFGQAERSEWAGPESEGFNWWRYAAPAERDIVPARDEGGYAVFVPGGLMAKRARVGVAGGGGGGGRRGTVSGLSADSRRRLVTKLMQVDWSDYSSSKRAKRARGFFVTLTYPGDWRAAAGEQWEGWKSHLKAFRKRLERSLKRMNNGLVAAIWRLEFQKRGAPHFHLVLFLARPVRRVALLGLLLRFWSELVRASADMPQGFAHHSRRGVDLRTIYGAGDRLMAYVSKYMSKSSDGEAGRVVDRETGEVVRSGCVLDDSGEVVDTGRVWGVWGDLPVRVVLAVALGHSSWAELVKRVRGMADGRSWFLAQFSEGRVFGDGWQQWRELLAGLVVRVLAVDGVDVSSPVWLGGDSYGYEPVYWFNNLLWGV